MLAPQEELSSARDALAEAKDTAVQWQDRAMEAAKELDASRRKVWLRRLLCMGSAGHSHGI